MARGVACLGGFHYYLSMTVITSFSLLRLLAYLPTYIKGCWQVRQLAFLPTCTKGCRLGRLAFLPTDA